MHISEGVLSTPVLAGGAVLAVISLAYAVKKLLWEHIMTVGVLSSAFFVASLIHIPVGPGSVHLVLNGLMGAILGVTALPAIAVALILQALLFQFGGITTLGLNICIMGFPAVLCGMIFRHWLRPPHPNLLAAFLCGACAVAGSALLVAAALIFSGEEFMATAIVLVTNHIPIMLLEGVITAIAVRFLSRVLPSLFDFSNRQAAPAKSATPL